MRSLFLTLAFLLLAGLCAGAAPLRAQSETDASLEAFLQELEAELERGEAERLIDPWFLKDIRALIKSDILRAECSPGGRLRCCWLHQPPAGTPPAMFTGDGWSQ